MKNHDTPPKESAPADTGGVSTDGASSFSMSGYVKLHRSLKEWEWYSDEAATRLFIHLLIEVNWKPGRWRGVDIPAGSMVTSLEKMAASLCWDRSKLRRTLDKLKSTGEVNIKTTNHWTLVTVGNWAKYQEDDKQTDQPKRQQTTDHRPTTDRPPNTIEEGKKERREEERKTLFASCRFMDIEAVKSALPELASEGVNLEHYRDAIRNWSDTKDEKRSERGWLATFRQWTKTDRDKGELKMVAGVVKHKSTGWLRPQRA